MQPTPSRAANIPLTRRFPTPRPEAAQSWSDAQVILNLAQMAATNPTVMEAVERAILPLGAHRIGGAQAPSWKVGGVTLRIGRDTTGPVPYVEAASVAHREGEAVTVESLASEVQELVRALVQAGATEWIQEEMGDEKVVTAFGVAERNERDVHAALAVALETAKRAAAKEIAPPPAEEEAHAHAAVA